jgi:hypothetical protein
MARSPQELLSKLKAQEEEYVDELEAELDETLDEKYEGGVFTHTVYERLSPRVQQEVVRRYDRWDVSFQESRTSNPHDGESFATQIRMSPSPPVPF